MTDFFNGVSQREISIRGTKTRAPLFYRDVNMMLAIFTADWKAAASLLPSSKYRPLSMVPGRALVGINCFEYKDTDIGPYNEVAISIGVRMDKGRTPGMLIAARSALSERYDAYILQLPVNTEIALHGGLDFFNYPKFLADIIFEEDEHRRTCRVVDPESGEPVYSFSGDKIRTKEKPRDGTFFSYPVMNKKIMKATMRARQIEWGRNLFGGGFRIEPGRHERTGLLSDLKLGRLLQYVYAPRGEAILFDPEELESLEG